MDTFNLLDQPWVPVITQTREYRELSLLTLFRTWDSLRAIEAANPPTTLALHRFLLAILHRACQGPTDEDHWEEIGESGAETAIAYLERLRDRFDLLHPEVPFLQDPGITREQAGEVYQTHVMHGNNTGTVFCHDHLWSNADLTLAEAACLLLRLQCFDVGGRKAGSSISAATMPLMDAANVLLAGPTLQQTLLLNLMQYAPQQNMPATVTGEDLPAWERPLQAPQDRIPTGYIDYLTYQWRRVRLFTQANGRVDRVASHAGDRLPKQLSTQQWECAISYRKVKDSWLPVRLQPQRSLWRDSAAFLQSSDGSNRPRILDWHATLYAGLPRQPDIQLQVLGLNVDNAKPLEWSRQQFSAPGQYLTSKPLWDALNQALEIAEVHQQVFRSARGSPYAVLAEALGYPSKQAGRLAASLGGETRYWSQLDREFLPLIAALSEDAEDGGNGRVYGAQRLPEWRSRVQQLAREAFTESIRSIRNFQARSAALNALERKLQRLAGTRPPAATSS